MTRNHWEWLEFKRKGPGYVALQRQPSKWPKGYYRRDLEEGPDWRVEYEREWSEKRKAAGLPYFVHDPYIPKNLSAKKPCGSVRPDALEITSRRAGQEGQSSSWTALDPQQMTA